MAWSASRMFVASIEAIMEGTAIDTDSDTFKIALFDNDITPDATATCTLANTAYAAGQWVSAGNEVYDATEWPVTGQALGSVTSGIATSVWTFDAADEVSDGTSATLANVYGCLVYDDTTSDYGLCFLYFGGINSVTDGSLTVAFNTSGICTITV